jgi:hypothetical protein
MELEAREIPESVKEEVENEEQKMQVGEAVLIEELPGNVDVYRHGEHLGQMTAQGLCEAAQIDEEALSECLVKRNMKGGSDE